MPLAPEIQPALINAKEAAKFLAIGKTALWQQTVCGEIPSVRIGRSVRYSVESLRRWIAEHESK